MTEDFLQRVILSAEETEKSALPPFPQLPNLTILKLLGQGAYGSVYVAEHQILKQKVAVKILHASINGAIAEQGEYRLT